MEASFTTGNTSEELVQYYPKRAYSFYEELIKNLRFQLKYINRHLRKTQTLFHRAEGKLHRALLAQCKKDNKNAPSEEMMGELRRDADFCMEAFCDMFKFQQKIVADLQDAIHADRGGKFALNVLKTNIVN